MTSVKLSVASMFIATILVGCLVGCMGKVGDTPSGSGNRTGPSGGAAAATGAAGSGAVNGGGGSGVVTTGASGSGVVLTGNGGGGGAVVATPCTAGVAVTSQVARLTNEQYDRTIRDLLGVTG